MQRKKCDDYNSFQRVGIISAERNFAKRREHLFDSFQTNPIHAIKSHM